MGMKRPCHRPAHGIPSARHGMGADKAPTVLGMILNIRLSLCIVPHMLAGQASDRSPPRLRCSGDLSQLAFPG